MESLEESKGSGESEKQGYTRLGYFIVCLAAGALIGKFYAPRNFEEIEYIKPEQPAYSVSANETHNEIPTVRRQGKHNLRYTGKNLNTVDTRYTTPERYVSDVRKLYLEDFDPQIHFASTMSGACDTGNDPFIIFRYDKTYRETEPIIWMMSDGKMRRQHEMESELCRAMDAITGMYPEGIRNIEKKIPVEKAILMMAIRMLPIVDNIDRKTKPIEYWAKHMGRRELSVSDYIPLALGIINPVGFASGYYRIGENESDRFAREWNEYQRFRARFDPTWVRSGQPTIDGRNAIDPRAPGVVRDRLGNITHVTEDYIEYITEKPIIERTTEKVAGGYMETTREYIGTPPSNEQIRSRQGYEQAQRTRQGIDNAAGAAAERGRQAANQVLKHIGISIPEKK